MDKKALLELLKSNDNLQDVEFNILGTNHKWYFRYLTLLEKVRIEQMCVKTKETIHENGNKTVEYEKQEHLIPIHTILEKALDENGKRLFSHTNPNDFELIAKLPAGIASYISYQMSLDIMGTLSEDKDNG